MLLYHEAWTDLTTTRSIGFGIGPIPWDACHAWCVSRGYDLSTELDIWAVIRRVDVRMMGHWRDRAENEPKKRGS